MKGLTESSHNPHHDLTRPRYNRESFEVCDVSSRLVLSAAPLAGPVSVDYAGSLPPAHLVWMAFAATGPHACCPAGTGTQGAHRRSHRPSPGAEARHGCA